MSKQTAWLRHREPLEKVWRIADAKGQVLGRLASQISKVLQGKHKPTQLDNIDCSDPIVVINARHFALTGRKRYNKEYIHYSGYPGGLKRVPIHEVMEKRPQDAIRLAVRNMLPVNKLRAKRLGNLHIFMDEEHPYKHLKPVPMPPAHAGHRLGTGGPPTKHEMEQWWLTHLSQVPDDILKEVLEEAKAEVSVKAMGLAQVLEFDEGSEPTGDEVQTVQTYLELASKEDPGNPVITPGAW